jgi:hypothetical protein
MQLMNQTQNYAIGHTACSDPYSITSVAIGHAAYSDPYSIISGTGPISTWDEQIKRQKEENTKRFEHDSKCKIQGCINGSKRRVDLYFEQCSLCSKFLCEEHIAHSDYSAHTFCIGCVQKFDMSLPICSKCNKKSFYRIKCEMCDEIFCTSCIDPERRYDKCERCEIEYNNLCNKIKAKSILNEKIV